MRPSLVLRGLTATAAALLLTACGGSSDDEAASSSTTSAAPSSSAQSSPAQSSSAAPEADSEFCKQAAQINERIASSVTTGDGSSLSDNLQTISEEISAVDPPAEIADDWNSLAGALGKAAKALDGVDLTKPDEAAKAQAELGNLQSELGDAGTNVEAYLSGPCGIDTEGTGTASGSAAPSS